MKKVFLMLAVMVSMLAANAQQEKTMVVSAGNIKHLVLGAGMKVMLANTNAAGSNIELSTAAMRGLEVSFAEGKMKVTPRPGHAGATVYVSVSNQLEKVDVGENTVLESNGILTGRQLDLFMEEGSKARVLTHGQVNAFAVGDYNVNVTRSPFQPAVAAAAR